ncbi:accessory Sec system protein Asp2 [Mesobacillus maritimus]|uniref:accessory Sec system protein Asp2 n=1 Tax=Mesobacillus maritimus TaxID=1643336 RepID=UPI00384B0F9C
MTSLVEEIYESNIPIKYVFEKGKVNKENLIIVFSDFNEQGFTALEGYDYLEELKTFDCNKLFILDNYGPKGCYYLGPDLNFEIETSVVSLISYIASISNVSNKNIITVGANKGGSAALYYGLKYNFGHIIAGNPHINIADYLLKHAKETAEYLLGYKPSKFKVEKLNKLIISQLSKNIISEINVIIGDNLEISKHSDELVQELLKKNIDYELYKSKEVQSFNGIKDVFLKYLTMQLTKIVEKIDIKKVIFDKNFSGNCRVKIESDNIKWLEKNEIRLRLSDDEKILKEYKVERELIIPHSELKELVDDPKLVKFEVGMIRNSVDLLTVPLDEIFIGNEFVLKDTDLSVIDGNTLNFVIDIEDSAELEFAYYIRKNKKVINKIMYISDREIKFPVESPGKYQIQYFIRKKGEQSKLLSLKTDFIEVG